MEKIPIPFLLLVTFITLMKCDNLIEERRCKQVFDLCRHLDDGKGYVILNCTSEEKHHLELEDIICCFQNECNHEKENAFVQLDLSTVKQFHLTNSYLVSLDLRLLRDRFTHLEILNLSRSDFANFTWDNCAVSTLKELDVSFNSLTDISQDLLKCNPNLTKMSMKGNLWSCEILEWFMDWVRDAEKKGLQVLDKKDVICENRNNIAVQSFSIWAMIDACPEKCSCVLKYGKSVVVDCSGRNLTDFPETIPKTTTSLFMQNNAIQSFQKMIQTSAYWNLTQLSVENNAIGSLAELEGILRKINIITLDLSGNHITHLPVHILTQMKLISLKIGRNPWDCDCKSGSDLRNFIIDSFRIVKDVNNITCSAYDKNHPNKLVRRLTRVDLCYVESSEIHILDVVNAFLALMIVIIFSKFVYDWWHFKNSGKLPLSPRAYFLRWKKSYLERKFENTFDSERTSLADGIKA